MKKLILLYCIMGFCSVAIARQLNDTPRPLLELPDARIWVHHEPNITLTMTNFGFIGSQGGAYLDPETNLPAPGFEFPAGSGLEYLFQGAIWIGGVVDTVDTLGNPILDTLVSVGNDGWWGQVFELLPLPPGYNSLWEDNCTGDEDIHTIYFDTLTDSSYVDRDPNDQRPHIPLGLKITQTSIAWGTPGYDEIIAVNFCLENLRQRNIYDIWFGVYYDGDVMHNSEMPYAPEEGAQDDLCGFIDRGEHGIAWLADNDGQPYSGQYESYSPRGVSGAVLVRSSTPGLGTSFNWWISNIAPEFDWGPQLLSNYRGPFPGGGRGTPGGDRAKYQVMSNLEIDYDQAYAAIPHPAWIDPPAAIADIANGFDTRYLISFGPIQLGAGEIETLMVAFLGGRNLHNDPANYLNNLKYHETDSPSVALYYQNLDFPDLIAKADSAVHFFQDGYPRPPLGPPHGLRATEWGQNHVGLAWQPRGGQGLRGYRLYRGTSPGVYEPVSLTPENYLDTTFVDNTVQDNVTYYYVIACLDSAGRQGGYSSEIAINTGIPHAPAGLTASAGNGQAQLAWTAVPENDISGYIVFRAFMNLEFEIVDSSSSNNYLDTGLRNGVRYRYKVAAFDDDGNASNPSDTVSVLPMGLDQGILLINANRRGQFCPDYDSIMAFYDRMLSSYRHSVIADVPDSLNDLANYSTVIWCHEHAAARIPIEGNRNFEIFREYLINGGQMVVAGQKIFMPYGLFGQRDFQTNEFPYNYLNLAGVRYSAGHTWDFDGGDATYSDPSFLDFTLDTPRVARIVNVPPMENGRLTDIGNLIPRDSSETIYTYRAMFPDTSSLHGYSIGIIHHATGYKTATLDFPLYYIQELTSLVLVDILMAVFNETVGIDEDIPTLPGQVSLFQNYPNPFNPVTSIIFKMPIDEEVRLEIFNLLGQKVATLSDGRLPAGLHMLSWDASGKPSGVYFARLVTGPNCRTIKMLLLR